MLITSVKCEVWERNIQVYISNFKLLDIVPDLRGSTVKLISVQFGLMQTLDSYH